MGVFDANADYDARVDVRNHDGLVKLLRAQPKKGVLFPLVGARRAGKTWTLNALELLVGRKRPGEARFIDLRRCGPNLPADPPARCLLLDEPELTPPGGSTDRTLLRRSIDLLRWCEALHAKGTTILLAMSPAEWVELRRAGEPLGLLSARDLRFLAPLTDAQARKLARTEWARALLPRIPEAWRRRPFLLEMVFQLVEEEHLDLAPGDDLSDLLGAVHDWSENDRFGYFRTVFWNGLDDAQRAALRGVARGEAADARDLELLEGSNLVERQAAGHVIGDPILAANLYPLRIHHLSDIHLGPKAGERVDIKERGAHADAMGEGLGSKHVADHYIAHVRELSARGRAPHLVVLSGDVAEWATDAEYAAACTWIAALQSLLAAHPRIPPDAPHVLVAGGNHDVDWSKVAGPEGRRARHRAFVDAFAGVPRALLARLDEPPESRPLAIARYPDLGVEVVLLGSAEFGGEIERDPVREEMLAFIEALRRKALDETDAQRAEELRAKVSRIDPGLVHQRDLERLRQDSSRYPVKIAVLHHPVSPLPFTELARFAGLVNAGEVKDALVEHEVCLVLHGHAHMGWFGKEQWPERDHPRDWVLRIAAAPSLGSREINEQNGYNEIAIAREPGDKDRSPYAIVVRRVVRKGASWEPGKTMGPFAPGT